VHRDSTQSAGVLGSPACGQVGLPSLQGRGREVRWAGTLVIGGATRCPEPVAGVPEAHLLPMLPRSCLEDLGKSTDMSAAPGCPDG
jgi:hypothetical protein